MKAQWTPDEMKRALTYGFCLVCLTPHEVQVVETDDGKVKTRKVSLVKPCGHTEADIERELERTA